MIDAGIRAGRSRDRGFGGAAAHRPVVGSEPDLQGLDLDRVDPERVRVRGGAQRSPLPALNRTVVAMWRHFLSACLWAGAIGAVAAGFVVYQQSDVRRAELRAESLARHEAETYATERAFYEALSQPGAVPQVACARIVHTSQAITGAISDDAMAICSTALGGTTWERN